MPLFIRLGIVCLAYIANILLFYVIQSTNHNIAFSSFLIPLLTLAWVFGLNGGFAAGPLILLSNILLESTLGHSDFIRHLNVQTIPWTVLAWVFGLMVGYIADLRHGLGKQLSDSEQALKSLSASEQVLRHLIEDAGDIIMLQDLEGHYLYYNGPVDFGMSAENVIGKTPFDFHDAETAGDLMEWVHQVATTGKATSNESFMVWNGQPMWFLNHKYPIRNNYGNLIAVGTISRDITTLKGTEDKLLRSEERFRLLTESMRDLVTMVNLEGLIEYASPSHLQTLGYRPEQMLGTSVFQYIHPNQQVAAQQAFSRFFIEDKPIQNELQFLHTDGRYIWLETVATPIKNNTQQTSGIVFACRDITERKLNEASQRDQQIMTEALRDSAAVISSSLKLDVVLERILENIHRVVPHTSANVMLVEHGKTRVMRSRGYSPELTNIITAIQYPVNETPSFSQMVNTLQPIVIPDITAYSGWVSNPGLEWIRSCMGAPIVTEGNVIGFINLDSAQPGSFSSTHAERLMAFANQVAIAVQNARLFEDARKRAEQMTLLNEITHAAIQGSTVEEVLDTLANRVYQLFNADGTYITQWDDIRQDVIPSTASGRLSQGYGDTHTEPNERNMTTAVLELGHPIGIEDPLNSPYLSAHIAILFKGQSLLGLPLMADNRKLGAVIIAYKSQHQFTPAELELAEQVSAQLSLAVSKAKALEEATHRTQELTRANQLITALSHVAARVESASDSAGILSTLGQELLSLNLHCMVSLTDISSDTFDIIFISVSELAELIKMFNLQNPGYFRFTSHNFPGYEEIVIERRSLFYTNIYPLVEVFIKDYPVVSIEMVSALAVINKNTRCFQIPMVLGDKVIGILGIWGEDLEETDLPAASVFTSQIAAALQNARLLSEVQHLAITDELTSIYNRRGLWEIGSREVERALRFERKLTVLVIDVDHFKLFNDTYSYRIGDEVLQMLADRCQSTLRRVDILARYGGEEFVILLVENNLENGVKTAERLRKAISEVPFETSIGSLRVTISIGVVELSNEFNTLSDLIDNAGKAAHHAKQLGRNQVWAIQSAPQPST